jgi:molybdate transport system permease protein
MSEYALTTAAFSALMALLGTTLALPLGVAGGWLFARNRFRGRSVLETLVTLPLVMPPVATGLLLLRAFGRRSPLGRALDAAGIEIVFTWKAVVIAMAVMSLPIILLTAKAGFEQLNPRFEQMAATLGARPLRIFWTISLPLAARSLVAAALLGFARALGEFGATIARGRGSRPSRADPPVPAAHPPRAARAVDLRDARCGRAAGDCRSRARARRGQGDGCRRASRRARLGSGTRKSTR